MKRLFISVFCFFIGLLLFSQNITYNWDSFVSDYFNEAPNENLYHHLELLSLHKLNLNTITKEELLDLPFISNAQADSILSFRLKHKEFISLGDLSLIKGLNWRDKAYLSVFTYVGKNEHNYNGTMALLTQGIHQIDSKFSIPFYKTQGDRNGDFLGNSIYHSVQYLYHYRDWIEYGGSIEKDKGEPIASYKNYPYDFYSFFLKYKTHNKHYTLFIGDYYVSAYQGLLFNHSLFKFKFATSTSPLRTDFRIHTHHSTSEDNFFRGIALLHNKNFMQQSLLISIKPIDATIKDNTIQTFYKSGYHRTIKELSKRNSAFKYSIGTDLSYTTPDIHIGISTNFTHFNYNVNLSNNSGYQFQGNNALNTSLSFRFEQWKRLSIVGELAFDKYLHPAYVHTLRFSPINYTTITLQERHIAAKYTTIDGKCLQENTHCSNEHGLLVSLQDQHLRNAIFNAYIDLFYLPQQTYNAGKHCKGMDIGTDFNYLINNKNILNIRYHFKTKQKYMSGYAPRMEYYYKNSVRVQYTNNMLSKWNFTTSLYGNVYGHQTKNNTYGWGISLKSIYDYQNYKIGFFTAYFNTKDMNTSIYSYVPTLPHTFGITQFSHNGLYHSQIYQLRIHKHWWIGAKWSLKKIFNQKTIGSGLLKVNHNYAIDAGIHMAYKFGK